jgi:hypothetical protein
VKIKMTRNQDPAPRGSKGSVAVRVTKTGIVATKWPKPRGPATTGGAFYNQQQFAIAGSWATNPEPISLQGAINFAKGTQYAPRDVLLMAIYGLLFEAIYLDGINWMSWRVATPNPQFLLDMIGEAVGSILRRDPIGWVQLLPGDEGDILTMAEGFPNWLPRQAAPLAPYILQTAYPGLPNALVLTGSNSNLIIASAGNIIKVLRSALTGDVTASTDDNLTTIANGVVSYAKMQNVSAASRVLGRKSSGSGAVQEVSLTELLDFIGSAAQGDILFRGASTWQRLGAGTNGQTFQTRGPGADPQWANPASSGGVDIQSFTTAGTFTGLSGWQKPIGARVVEAWVTGAGGGGGSGRRGPTSENTGGGAGGGGGGLTWSRFQASSLPSQVDITVGAKGTGHAGTTSDATSGLPGTVGGNSYFGALTASAYFLSATGGGAGGGGTTAAVGGASGGTGRSAGGGGGGGANAGAGSQPTSPSAPAPTGGGGGAGLFNTSRDTRNGGAGGSYATTAGFFGSGHTNTAAAGGVGSTKTAAQVGTQAGYEISCGQGGGGGWCNNDGTAGSGAAGASPGGGGGGGGGSNNGNVSGAGGDGADGQVIVITYL